MATVRKTARGELRRGCGGREPRAAGTAPWRLQNTEPPGAPAIPPLGVYPRKTKTQTQKALRSPRALRRSSRQPRRGSSVGARRRVKGQEEVARTHDGASLSPKKGRARYSQLRGHEDTGGPSGRCAQGDAASCAPVCVGADRQRTKRTQTDANARLPEGRTAGDRAPGVESARAARREDTRSGGGTNTSCVADGGSGHCDVWVWTVAPSAT